jgi:hypothetical protein
MLPPHGTGVGFPLPRLPLVELVETGLDKLDQRPSDQANALVPVMSRPMISACTLSVPS